jgi:hypothetical protein
MSVKFKVNYAALLRWSRYLDEMPKRTRPAIARALNDYGRGVARSKAQAVAAETGLDEHDVLNLIEVEEATSENLVWRMDATKVAMPPPDWERPWDKRSDKAFQQQTLVKIVTSGDDTTCEICSDAASKNPYTMEEINALSARWQHFDPGTAVVGERTNLLHPNCRCAIQPWQQTRRLSMRTGAKGAPEELLNARQLGRRVADEIKVAIRAVKL